MDVKQWFRDIRISFQKTIGRYPLVFIIALITCIYVSANLMHPRHVDSNIVLALVVSGLSSILLYNIADVIKLNNLTKQFFAMGGLIIGALFYWIYRHMLLDIADWKAIVVIVIIICIILFYLLIPFLKNKDNSTIHRYLVHFLENFGESAVLSIILYLVLISAISAISMLVDLDITRYNIYQHLGIWTVGLFMPLNFLSHSLQLPLDYEKLPTYKSRFFRTLILYIGIPVTMIYGIIIFGYVIKYLITGQYKDWTLTMFTWFITLALLIYFLNKVFIKDCRHEIASLFDKYFPYLGIILSISFLWICYISISTYGLTTPYYYATIFGIVSLLVFLAIGFLPDLDYRHILFLFLAASGFSIVSGRFDCYELPISNQTKRLRSFLENNNRYSSSGFKYSDAKVAKDELSNLTKGLNMLDIEAFDTIVRQLDKGHFFKDTLGINTYDFFQKIGMDNNVIGDLHQQQNKYYELNPVIKFDQNDEYLPVINTYMTVPKTFNGARIHEGGSIHIYKNGQAADSITLYINQLGQQLIKAKSFVDLQKYDIHIQSLSYETNSDVVLIKDFMGLLIKKNKRE